MSKVVSVLYSVVNSRRIVMAPLPPVVVAGAAAVGKTVLQGTVLVGSTVAAVKGIQALGGGGDHGSQNVIRTLLAHLKQKE